MTTCEHTLSGTLIFLRELTEADATESYAHWLNDPEVNQWLETRHVTVPELRTYIREKRLSSNALLFGIFWKENGQHIGNIKLEPMDRENGEATIGILIGEKAYWGKGVATEATNLVTDFAFRNLHMHAVNLGVISENKSAIHVYEKCGFTLVRKEKEKMNHDGILYDAWYFQKLAP